MNAPTRTAHHTSALVLFSGGQDSTTCLAHALARYPRVETIGFDYGQRHSVELQARTFVLQKLREQFPAWGERLGEDHLLDLAVLGQGQRHLAHPRHGLQDGGPAACPTPSCPAATCCSSRWPPRWPTGATSRSSSPASARPTSAATPTAGDDTMKALQVALSLGMDHRLPHRHAADVDRQGADLAHGPTTRAKTRAAWPVAAMTLVDLIVEHTHTCYLGDREHRQDWGYGCGSCPACELRARGWAGYRAMR